MMYTSPPGTRLRVLVADDDNDMRAFIVEALRASGCTTVEASDGDEVLSMLSEAIDSPELRPDVIVTDVKMPHLSGFGVLAALRRASWSLPVVMITVVSDASIHTVARRLGAVGVLHKPFDPADLVTAVWNAKAASALQH